MKKIKQALRAMPAGAVLSFAFAFMICVYAPYELLLTNKVNSGSARICSLFPSLSSFCACSLFARFRCSC